MPIDECPHRFVELAAEHLPARMRELRQGMASPVSLKTFGPGGNGPKSLQRLVGTDRDFHGCYVIMDDTTPIYVGIAGGVCKRLIQHVRRRSHYSASLAYRMASLDQPHKMRRNEAMADADFSEAFVKAQSKLSSMWVAAAKIPNPVELYLFEVYAALELDTHPLNTFKTH